MTSPAVSVIIPCYNSAGTIADTLASLQKQTRTDWEAVIVDDGSTDASGGVIAAHAREDARFHVITQANRGLGGARNAGLAWARRSYLLCLDSDDTLLPPALEQMVGVLEGDGSLGAVHCGWTFSDPLLHDTSWVNFSRWSGSLLPRLAHGNLFPCHSILFRRALLDDVGTFDEALRHCHDWDLWVRLARIGVGFGFVEEPLAIYRMAPGTLSRHPGSFFRAGVEVMRRAHLADPRVSRPLREFADGCPCGKGSAVPEPWLLHCLGLAIASGDVGQASGLVAEAEQRWGFRLKAEAVPEMLTALWFGSAIPRGQWAALRDRSGRHLLAFLAAEEERQQAPGFAMRALTGLLRQEPSERSTDPERRGGRRLLGLLARRLAGRLGLDRS